VMMVVLLLSRMTMRMMVLMGLMMSVTLEMMIDHASVV